MTGLSDFRVSSYGSVSAFRARIFGQNTSDFAEFHAEGPNRTARDTRGSETLIREPTESEFCVVRAPSPESRVLHPRGRFKFGLGVGSRHFAPNRRNNRPVIRTRYSIFTQKIQSCTPKHFCTQTANARSSNIFICGKAQVTKFVI